MATSLHTENKEGPLFISLNPSSTGHTRNFPTLATTLKNLGTSNVEPSERLSTVARTLHFALVARDQYNGPGGGSADTATGSWHAGFTNVHVSKAGPLSFVKPTISDGNQNTGALTVEW